MAKLSMISGTGPASVMIVGVGKPNNKIALIKTLRELTGWGLSEAKKFVESAERGTVMTLVTSIPASEASRCKESLEPYGAKVEIQGFGIDLATVREALKSESRADVLPGLLEAAQYNPEALDILIADALSREDLVQADHWQTRKRLLQEGDQKPSEAAQAQGSSGGSRWFGVVMDAGNDAFDFG